MIYLSVIKAHSLENSDIPKKALINDGSIIYYELCDEVERQMTDGNEIGSRNCSIANFGFRNSD